MSRTKKSSAVPVLITLLILLLGALGYLLFERSQFQSQNENLRKELNQANDIRTELETSFNEANDQLDNLKTDNVELNSLIEEQKIEINKKRIKINRLISIDRKYKQAKEEIESLKAETAKYISEIQKLKDQNIELTKSNTSLLKAKTELSKEVQVSKEKNIALEEKTKQLSSYNEKIAEERDNLSKKVNKASVIQIENIEVTGYTVKNSGRLARRKKAKNVEQLNVCFTATKNEVTSLKEEEFFLRIVDPLGETMSIESLGSGILIKESDQQPIKYTNRGVMQYNNEDKQVCMEWKPGIAFPSGTYEIEVYNKGYLSGKTTARFK